MTTNNQHQSSPPRITRSLVLELLQDPEDLNDFREDGSPGSLFNSQSASSLLDGTFHIAVSNDTSLPPAAGLKDIRLWLDVQCDLEQAQVDWTTEYGRHSRGEADQFGAVSQGPDISVIDRIRRGYGPRSPKYEDLLWPLRLKESQSSSSFSKQPKIESFRTMVQVLRDWNKHVASAYEDPEARQLLMDAMHARVAFLDRMLIYRRSADAHDETSRKLLHAIHAYRPETAAFVATDTCGLLTIILAPIGYAIPDIDQKLKYLVFYTLVTQRIHMAQAANAGTRRKLEEDITIAKQQRNVDFVAKYKQKMNDWQREIFQHNCDLIADKVKFARRNVELQALEELQTLTILQSAQKMALNDRLPKSLSPTDILIPRSTWLLAHSTRCDSAATAFSTATDIQLTSLLASASIASQGNHDMEHISHARVLTRALKFAGLDVKNISEIERRRLVKERMAHPGTVNMMWNAIQGIAETKAKAKDMVDAMDTMDAEMEKVLSKAKEMMEEWEDFAELVGTEVLADVGLDLESERVE
ncbi:hypothetical protein DE146DRAFT_405665 [Phaeosphaeria sp. MPI-PUGE-AT-0046c]|nr:hypothetical protein DE146DRAFT_405665 [Phaeosphaeria sp. MPI-PUGE-AT-0046c]